MNYFKTSLLLAAMTALFMVVGNMLGGSQGMWMAFIFALATNAFSYWFSDKMVLRMHGAQEVDRATAPELFSIVEQLVQRAGLPMPKVYIMQNPQPNAFATGRNPSHAAVAATTGLLEMLDKREVAAVLAHELGHVKNRDTLTMTITATIAGAIGSLAHMAMFFGRGQRQDGTRGNPIAILLVTLLAPLAAMLVQMAISRTREYSADKAGAEISGDPEALASALAKISGGAARIPNPVAEANPASAHMFIVNPLTGGGMDSLFSTHPNPQNRIKALMEMARSGVRPVSPWG